jgi:hypothetical protein
MTKFNTQYDLTSPFSSKTAQFGLNANTALTFTVPGTDRTTYNAVFSFGADANVWVGFNVTATTPTKNTMTNNQSIVLNPVSKFVRGGDVLSFISISALSDAGIELFSLPG